MSTGSTTVQALERAWATLRAEHPDMSERVTFVIGTGSQGKRGFRKMGHFTVNPVWKDRHEDDSRYHEIFIAGETLAQDPLILAEVIAHEAVHDIAHNRGVKDTSRQNRYHNKRFVSIANELGLAWQHTVIKVEKDDEGKLSTVYGSDGEPVRVPAPPDTVIGFSDVTWTDEARESDLIQSIVAQLDRDVSVEMPHHRIGTAPPKKRRTVCLVSHWTTERVADEAEAFDIAGGSFDSEDIQRIGIVVYEGLEKRGLLDGHLYWVEEV